ncbi:MAG TPA: hypothetical protein VD966_09710 [Pyrinomonadaceae bacterium]|nr:hypothetical protein [Pyrinomonadaceae bacterium]
MADDNPVKSTLEESTKDEGLKPKSAPNAVEEVANDERSLDYGESGQFAPGGYYNQQGVLEADRIDLDEGLPKRSSGESKK